MSNAPFRFLKSVISVIAALTLTMGLFPTLSVGGATQRAYASEAWQRTQALDLVPGTYIEGEALAYVIANAPDEISAQSSGDDLLAGSESIMSIDAEADPAGGKIIALSSENAALAATPAELPGLTVNSRPATTADLPQGTITLVHSNTLSTEELIAALEQDPRVLFAEPNYRETADTSEVSIYGETTDASDVPIFKETADASEEHGIETQESTTVSTWGPDRYDSATDIPDMTRWQWGNCNNGSMAGTYTPNTAPDIQYSKWNDPSEQLPEVVVAVIDCGVDETNPDLENVLWEGPVFAEGGDHHGFCSFASDTVTSTTGLTEYHGTHVAGIIAAEWNGIGTSGVAPNVRIMSLRHKGTALSSTLACVNYAKLAAEQGVKLAAINNSWGFVSYMSNIFNIAVTQLGHLGAVSVFASGNETQNTDIVQDGVSILANNPYALTVDAINPNESVTEYSNFGINTTDICAPGSTILSTTAGSLREDNWLQYAGEVDAYAPEGTWAKDNLVSYTSFGNDTRVNPLTFSVAVAEDGTMMGANLKNPKSKPPEGAFDGEDVLSIDTIDTEMGLQKASIRSDQVNLSQRETKPRYVSFRMRNASDEAKVSVFDVQVPVILTEPDGTVIQKQYSVPLISNAPSRFGGWGGEYLGCCCDLSAVEWVETEEEDLEESCRIDWEHFTLTITASCSGNNANTVYFDSIALGSGRYPYEYNGGTSMATPYVTGVVAVLAGKHQDSLGMPGTAAFAEKLAALTKGAGEKSSWYKNVCATSAYATVDGAKNPGPSIVSVQDGAGTFSVTGYFLDNASVTLNDTGCSAVVNALGNDKYQLTVTKPAGYAGGSATITTTGNEGKIDRMTAPLTAATGETPENIFDQIVIPDDMAALISSWPNYQVVGYAGKLYFLPRATAWEETVSYSDSVVTYNTSGGSWERVNIPAESFLFDGEPLVKDVVDVTGCLVKGKLALLITGILPTRPNHTENILVSLDEEQTWTPIGHTAALGNGTLASDGSNLYFVGGVVMGAWFPQPSDAVMGLTVGEDGILTTEQVADLSSTPQFPSVTYQNGKLLVSGGTASRHNADPSDVVDMVDLASGEVETIDLLPHTDINAKGLEYSTAGLADGTFILVGPTNKYGTSSTYKVTADGTVTPGNMLAYAGDLYFPSSVAYDGALYVIATVSPTGEGTPTTVLTTTPMNSAVALGDALARPLATGPAQTGTGMPAFANTDIPVTTQDIYDGLGTQKASELIDATNRADAANPTLVYLTVKKLTEDSVPVEAKAAIVAAVQKAIVTEENLFWMDVNELIQAGKLNPMKLSTSLDGVQATMGLPAFPPLQEGYTRIYKVFAYDAQAPEGERLMEIDPTFDQAKCTLGFGLPTRGTYAIGYMDEKVPGPDPDPVPPGPDPKPDSPEPGPDPESNPPEYGTGLESQLELTPIPDTPNDKGKGLKEGGIVSIGDNALLLDALPSVLTAAALTLALLFFVRKRRRR